MSRRVDPEQELLKALREQEPTAAEALVTAYGDRAYRLAVISDWSSSVDDPTVQTELRAVLSSAISELPTHYRAVTVLCDVERLSMGEVADALGITVPTAKVRAHRARLLLRNRQSMFMARPDASVGESAQKQSTPSTTSARNESRHRRTGCVR